MTMSLTESSVFDNLSWFERLCRKFALDFISQLQHGDITVVEGNQRLRFGDEHAQLKAVITVVDPAFYQKLVLAGSVGGGEAYIYGWWRCDNLTALVRIFALNLTTLDKLDSAITRLGRPFLKLLNWRNRNSKAQARKNIAAHYDLGNDMYRLFLDDSMMYSSAVYPSADADLASAQQHKLQLICQRLQLKASDHLLEIGTGWGSMAIYAAQYYGCTVTTTTISQQQYDYTKARIEALGLQDKINLLLSDYRDLDGQYDKLVSIEMIEAVGEDYLDTYFAKCASLLTPDGLMVLQAITIVDQRYNQYVREVDFIKRYVFPGGCLPSIHRMTDAISRKTDLVVRHLQDIGFDYAQTLKDWCDNFMHARDKVHQLGYDDNFVRLWQFYLCYCEGGFRERATSAVHLVLSKPDNRSV
ncbi:MAG: cyclopropane-fatty-acyl-phospholipid synthase family protein [Gammaproteobacteria bacterium]|nr:cyclopropane-fatty-acyl-phospholipid synthase family protein [Gammaproteobacteria bacterium]MBU1553637.1 cyclopropane-fatty-acyl-phospholipid synthase family protein [Gammaproteobacteria bacterium]MBU2070172.1 cyclopropane-fatty-acyl-phospholipid synthase family protein [Gammaproteobacteria bacterium]MBU2183577.1 cyclopropane-fatty-acyl-phospholipid synthase family protein [Gammaproteobacteria bacterium]MBU2204728.1 cyclopropane-fatty-acyl-phospholipid synthase family protein [Gammaproteobac